MGRRKKIINKTDFPNYVIESVARCFYSDMLEYWNSDKGKREYNNYLQQNKLTKNQIIKA